MDCFNLVFALRVFSLFVFFSISLGFFNAYLSIYLSWIVPSVFSCISCAKKFFVGDKGGRKLEDALEVLS